MRRRLPLHKSVGGAYAGHGAEVVDLLLRDGELALICPWCERTLTIKQRGEHHRGTDRTIDHIVPLSDGGTDRLDNLVLVCWDCNQERSGR